MDKTLEGKLVEILSDIVKATKAAGDFAIEQLPDIAMQYVLYARVKSVVEFGLFLVISIILFAYSYWAYKNPWNSSDNYWDRDNKRSESNHVAMFLPAFFGVLILIPNILEFNYLVWLAPKVWLLKELAGMLK